MMRVEQLRKENAELEKKVVFSCNYCYSQRNVLMKTSIFILLFDCNSRLRSGLSRDGKLPSELPSVFVVSQNIPTSEK